MAINPEDDELEVGESIFTLTCNFFTLTCKFLLFCTGWAQCFQFAKLSYCQIHNYYSSK